VLWKDICPVETFAIYPEGTLSKLLEKVNQGADSPNLPGDWPWKQE